MQRLFLLQEQLINLTPMEIVRECAFKINWDSQLVAIRGPKGVGKSTIIRQYIKQHYSADDRSALYCSLDANYFVDHSILDLVEQFYRMGGKHLFLDEVHKYPNWSREIKEVYDYYPDLRVVISGSSLLSLMQGDGIFRQVSALWLFPLLQKQSGGILRHGCQCGKIYHRGRTAANMQSGTEQHTQDSRTYEYIGIK